MSLTITLTGELETELQRRAEIQHRPVEVVAIELLNDALDKDDFIPTLDETIAKIKALPPNPHAFVPGKGSLAEALRNSPHDPDFDLETWQKDWEVVEKEMKSIELADQLRERLNQVK